MARAQHSPFAFADLNAAPAAEKREATREPAPTAADVEAAFASGLAAGAAQREMDAQASIAASLARIAERVTADAGALARAAEADRLALMDAARAFLTHFARGLASMSRIESALGVFNRFVAASADGEAAVLKLDPAGHAAIGAALAGAFQARGPGRIVSIESDAALQPGDVRLEWRGGAAGRNIDDAFAEIDRLIDAIGADRPGLREEKP